MLKQALRDQIFEKKIIGGRKKSRQLFLVDIIFCVVAGFFHGWSADRFLNSAKYIQMRAELNGETSDEKLREEMEKIMFNGGGGGADDGIDGGMNGAHKVSHGLVTYAQR